MAEDFVPVFEGFEEPVFKPLPFNPLGLGENKLATDLQDQIDGFEPYDLVRVNFKPAVDSDRLIERLQAPKGLPRRESVIFEEIYNEPVELDDEYHHRDNDPPVIGGRRILPPVIVPSAVESGGEVFDTLEFLPAQTAARADRGIFAPATVVGVLPQGSEVVEFTIHPSPFLRQLGRSSRGFL